MSLRLTLVLGLAAASLPAALSAAPPRVFLSDAIRGDNSEVAIGQLAARRGASNGVRDFGTMLARDHAGAKQDAVAAARRLRVPVPAGMKPEAVAGMRRLQRLSGVAFDREFKRMMVADHIKDIRKFEMQAAGREPVTAQLARNTLPALRHHLDVARGL